MVTYGGCPSSPFVAGHGKHGKIPGIKACLGEKLDGLLLANVLGAGCNFGGNFHGKNLLGSFLHLIMASSGLQPENAFLPILVIQVGI